MSATSAGSLEAKPSHTLAARVMAAGNSGEPKPLTWAAKSTCHTYVKMNRRQFPRAALSHRRGRRCPKLARNGHRDRGGGVGLPSKGPGWIVIGSTGAKALPQSVGEDGRVVVGYGQTCQVNPLQGVDHSTCFLEPGEVRDQAMLGGGPAGGHRCQGDAGCRRKRGMNHAPFGVAHRTGGGMIELGKPQTVDQQQDIGAGIGDSRGQVSPQGNASTGPYETALQLCHQIRQPPPPV